MGLKAFIHVSWLPGAASVMASPGAWRGLCFASHFPRQGAGRRRDFIADFPVFFCGCLDRPVLCLKVGATLMESHDVCSVT